MNYLHLLNLVAPETLVVVTALFVLVLDLTTARGVSARVRFLIGGLFATLGCGLAIASIRMFQQHGNIADGMLVVDPLSQLVKIALVALAIFTIWLSVDTDFTTHVGEYIALILLATVGMMFLVSSEDILMIFISLELTSLSLYILTAFNKRDVKSAEASLKYFLFGGMSAAITLFGLSLIYGVSGATNLREIAAALAGKGLDPLLVIAIIMTVIGFGFKVAAVPFHLWAPDAYQGAPAPSAALIASGSKVASFFIFAKVMMFAFAGVEGSSAWHDYDPGWTPVIAISAALSMVLGNFVAIVQTSVRRLLAYSAIAHAGYMLLAVLSHGAQSFGALMYYAITYGLTTVGAFGVVSVVEQQTGGDKLSDFAGLSRRSPVTSLCMLVFMLSLAGIPPLAGFFGKFYVFAAAVNSDAPGLGLLWLVVLAIATSAVSLYYYLQVLKRIYVSEPPTEGVKAGTPVISEVVLALLALGVVLLGCFPGCLVNSINMAIQQAGF